MPDVGEWSAAAKTVAHEALRDLIDGVSGNGRVVIRDADETMLAVLPLARPCGEVQQDGSLVLAFGNAAPAFATGVPAFADIDDSSQQTHHRMPCAHGESFVPGSLAIDAEEVVAGFEVNVVAAVIL